MDKEKYLSALGAGTAVSVGLAAYVSYVLTETHYTARQVISLKRSMLNNTVFLSSGSVRLFLQNEDDEEHTLLFYPEGSFICIEPDMVLNAASCLHIEFLEHSTLLQVPGRHIHNLYKLFPEYYRIQEGLNRNIKKTLFSHQLNLSNFDAAEKYNRFLSQFPHISLVCEQKKIASFLGIDPKTLSRLRGKPKDK